MFVTFGLLILLTVTFLLIVNSITKHTGFSINPINDESDFQICLNEQHVILYINSADSTETIRGMELRDDLKGVDIVNCYTNNQPCISDGIKVFPTWVINEFKLEHDISLQDLIKYSGCRLL